MILLATDMWWFWRGFGMFGVALVVLITWAIGAWIYAAFTIPKRSELTQIMIDVAEIRREVTKNTERLSSIDMDVNRLKRLFRPDHFRVIQKEAQVLIGECEAIWTKLERVALDAQMPLQDAVQFHFTWGRPSEDFRQKTKRLEEIGKRYLKLNQNYAEMPSQYQSINDPVPGEEKLVFQENRPHYRGMWKTHKTFEVCSSILQQKIADEISRCDSEYIETIDGFG